MDGTERNGEVTSDTTPRARGKEAFQLCSVTFRFGGEVNGEGGHLGMSCALCFLAPVLVRCTQVLSVPAQSERRDLQYRADPREPCAEDVECGG